MFLMEDLNFRRMRRRVTSQNRHSLGSIELNNRLNNKFTNRPSDALEMHGESVDILESKRHINNTDVQVVAPQLGTSWHLLGLRLNFSPETLDSLQMSSPGGTSDPIYMAVHMLTVWSLLPKATVGRLATVLWEMGRHDIALQLNP